MTTKSSSASLDYSDLELALYRKIRNRIIPILFICYILAYLDRVNVGFAKLQMQAELHMSDAVYGIGAGVFFIGYFFFEVPANVALQKIGARLWLGCIMILWGVVSACTMFVRSATDFYLLRFLLGVIESGFFPGVILYLTFWYPRFHRARMTAAFMAAIPLSGVVGGPVSGWILAHLSHSNGLHGWQWLYLIEGLPSVVAGLVSLVILADNPQTATWLNDSEKLLVANRLSKEDDAKGSEARRHSTLADAFRCLPVWIFCFIYFGFVMGSYGVGFWLPQMISDTVTSNAWQIGLLSVIPWATGAIAMLAIAHHSDTRGERRWHISVAGFVGALAFAVSAIPGISGALSFVAITIATAGIMGTIAVFWTLPTGILSSTAAAAGIAWINSVGNLAGYVSPSIIGRIRDVTHNMTPALLMLSCFMLASSIVVACLSQRIVGGTLASAADRPAEINLWSIR
jgi:sugar phosphate permease